MSMYNTKEMLPELMPEWENGLQMGLSSGSLSDYKPWFTVQDFHSMAVRARVASRKFGRLIHAMSAGEIMMVHRFDWEDLVYDIKEQYPLDPILTLDICQKLGFNHPGYRTGGKIMTSDFLVSYKKDPELYDVAYQIKRSEDDLVPRDKEKLEIEREFWRRRGKGFKVLYSSKFNKIFHQNLAVLYPYRQRMSKLSGSDFAALKEQVADLLSWHAPYSFGSFNLTLSQLPDSKLCMTGHEALKFLCAAKLLSFPIEEKRLFDCTLGDFCLQGG